MKKIFWTLLAVVALTAAWNGVHAILAPDWDDECGQPPARFIDYEGRSFREGFVPIRPTSALSESTLQYRLVSRDGSPVLVTFSRRYFEDLEGAAWGFHAAGPEEVAREKGATPVASGTLVAVDGFDRIDSRLVLVRLLGPDLTGKQIPYGVCVARRYLRPL